MTSRRAMLSASMGALAALRLGATAANAQVGLGPVIEGPVIEGALVEGPVIETDDDLEAALPALSNWGRWGAEDQLGTLNHVTAEMRIAAAQSVRSGRVVSLAHERGVGDPDGVRRLDYKNFRYTDPLPEEAGSIDAIGMIYHGFTITHLDALCHIFTPEGRMGMYNGHPISAVTEAGAALLGVERMGEHGIVGRGVLLDLAALRGAPLEIGSVIRPADLEAAEAAQGLVVGTGDILFVRNGGGARNRIERGTGLHASCLPWLRAREVALLSSDSDSDVHPPPPGFARWTEPIHMVAIPYLGMPLICGADLEAVSAACAEEGRWSFMLSVAPWRFRGATSSPVNPLALF